MGLLVVTDWLLVLLVEEIAMGLRALVWYGGIELDMEIRYGVFLIVSLAIVLSSCGWWQEISFEQWKSNLSLFCAEHQKAPLSAKIIILMSSVVVRFMESVNYGIGKKIGDRFCMKNMSQRTYRTSYVIRDCSLCVLDVKWIILIWELYWWNRCCETPIKRWSDKMEKDGAEWLRCWNRLR